MSNDTKEIPMDYDTLNAPDGLNKQQLMEVYRTIQNSTRPMGCSLEDIVVNVKSCAPLTIKQILSFLCDEGYVFSTIDDWHFKHVSFMSNDDDTKEIPMDYDPSSLNKQQMMEVYRTIQNSTRPMGCSLEDIVENVKSCAPSTIKQILSFLCDEGYIFSTIDEWHFKATDDI